FQTVGPLTYEDQFIQITTLLSSEYFYGLGETAHETLRRPFNQRRTTPIFTRDRLHRDGTILRSSSLLFDIEDNDGNTHSVFLDNSNAMEFPHSWPKKHLFLPLEQLEEFWTSISSSALHQRMLQCNTRNTFTSLYTELR
ncbi:hypothetical protein Avbf_13717, partial [Armadillidium vulgare]